MVARAVSSLDATIIRNAFRQCGVAPLGADVSLDDLHDRLRTIVSASLDSEEVHLSDNYEDDIEPVYADESAKGDEDEELDCDLLLINEDN